MLGFLLHFLRRLQLLEEQQLLLLMFPYHTTTTITSIWTGSATTSSTYTNPTDSIDTVVVQVPLPNPTVTTTQFWSGSVPTTETVTTGPQGTDSDHQGATEGTSVIVVTDQLSFGQNHLLLLRQSPTVQKALTQSLLENHTIQL